MNVAGRYDGIILPEYTGGVGPVTIMNAKGRVLDVIPANEFRARGPVVCIKHTIFQCWRCLRDQNRPKRRPREVQRRMT